MYLKTSLKKLLFQKLKQLNNLRPISSSLLKKLKEGATKSIADLHCSSAVKDLIKWYVEAGENRRMKTLAVPRLLLAAFMLLSLFWFDALIFQHAKQVLQSFSDKKTREKNRKEHLKQA